MKNGVAQDLAQNQARSCATLSVPRRLLRKKCFMLKSEQEVAQILHLFFLWLFFVHFSNYFRDTYHTENYSVVVRMIKKQPAATLHRK
jgi:hypothetical protein